MTPKKKCKACAEEKKFSDFCQLGDGTYKSKCKACCSIEKKAWYVARGRKRYEMDAERIKERARRRHNENKEILREKAKFNYRKNRERRIESARQWVKNNPDKRKEIARKHAAKTRSTSKGQLNSNMASAIYYALSGNKAGRRWESLVGYAVDDLKRHLEKQFKKHPGMSWENYGMWHVDHIVPKAAFNYTTAEDIDFKKCWSLKNLQPMWAKDNMKKGAKLTQPHQPSLLMALQ